MVRARVILISAVCCGVQPARNRLISAIWVILQALTVAIADFTRLTKLTTNVTKSMSLVYFLFSLGLSHIVFCLIESFRDVFCGLLHCSHLNEGLKFGIESIADLTDSFVTIDGKIVPCRTANFDHRLQNDSPGLVPNGAKCAQDKVAN